MTAVGTQATITATMAVSIHSDDVAPTTPVPQAETDLSPIAFMRNDLTANGAVAYGTNSASRAGQDVPVMFHAVAAI